MERHDAGIAGRRRLIEALRRGTARALESDVAWLRRRVARSTTQRTAWLADRRPQVTPAARVGYVLSLPERALRSGTGLVGGVLRESASLLVPRSFQNSRTYGVMVRQMLDFLVHDVGGVEQQQGTASSTAGVDNYVARKTVGNFVDMASLATLHISPLVIAGGGQRPGLWLAGLSARAGR